jgi:hypothetical protein
LLHRVLFAAVHKRKSHAVSRSSALVAAALILAGCTTEHVTEPTQTATEQLMVSAAVDHAVDSLKLALPRGAKVFVDTSYVDMPSDDKDVVLPKYMIGTVRDLILRSGAALVDDKKAADVIAELRLGAQSADRRSFLIGIPSITLPILLTGAVTTPEVALYKRDLQRGVSKLALTLYSAKTGMLTQSTGPTYGDSRYIRYTALLLFSWTDQNIEPEPVTQPAPAQ